MMKTKWLLPGLCLLAQAALAVTNFEFVVIGDTRPRFESENFRVFEGLIPKINAAHPAFVINLGDLIYGYGPLRKRSQWDQYAQVIRGFTVPYYQLPGNHDIHSRDAARVYLGRFGRLYESFDYGDCHFVLLDNCEDGRWGYLGPGQLEWLQHDLKAASARSVFVFMHFPVWEPEIVAPACHAFWRDTLQPLFRESRVKAVFGGHTHCYGPTREFDGIRYFITGGGGAELRPDYRKAGGEHHFVKVRVAGDTLDVCVVTDRGELTDVEADLMGGFLFAERNSTRIGITQGTQDPKQGVAFEIALSNPYREPLTGRAVWNFDASQFAVNPREVTLRVPAGQTERLPFTLQALRQPVAFDAQPWLAFDVSAGGQRHRFQRQILFLQSLTAPARTPPLPLGGPADGWTNAPRLTLGGTDRQAARIQAAHDAANLYLRVDVPADGGPLSEDSAFPDDLQIGIAGRSGDTGFGGETLRLGLRAGGGTVEVGDRTPGHVPGPAGPDVKAACRRVAGRTIFAVAIPNSRLPRAERVGGKLRLVAGFSFPIPDGGEAGAGQPAEPSPNTFAYQVRYGGDALVPVHFVELILAPDAR